MENKGYIFDIKKYAIHDGPGIRTTVFFKGCPLNCWWCHNPESQSENPEEIQGCTFRWRLSEKENPNLIGQQVSHSEIMREIKKDIIFYEESGGGVTFSGGEPMLQIDFLHSLLKDCKKLDLNTAIDTTGYLPFDSFEKIGGVTDIYLYDLKLMNEQKHIEYTGVSNKLIHENLKKLTDTGARVFIRIPIIPSITDTEENIDSLLNFISGLKKIEEIDLLPFHKAGNAKYQKMNKLNKVNTLEPPSDDEMNSLREKFSALGTTVKIGG